MKKNQFNLISIALSLAALVVLGVVFYTSKSPSQDQPAELPPDQPDIMIQTPAPNQEVQSPLAVSGQARGSWFFEAVFPVKIEDEGGEIIAQGQAQAAGDWMTADFVMFDALISFEVSEKQKAVLVLQNDNPSGLPEKAKEFRVPVILLPAAKNDFNQAGNLIKSNPDTGQWYLSYEEPGKPGLSALLAMDGAKCQSADPLKVCDINNLVEGQRVQIAGLKVGDMVVVSAITDLNEQLSQEKEISLYYYDPSRDKDASGNVLCSKKGLVAVKRMLPATITPIQDAIKLLIKGELTAAEKQAGLTTEYPLSGLELKGAAMKNGVLVLDLADPKNLTSGGACRVAVLWYQIEATAKQFPEVRIVRPSSDTLFQP